MLKSDFIKKYGAFINIFLISTLVYISNQMIATTISKFADYLGAGSSLVGMVAGSFAMMALFMRPFSGQAVDNLNRKKLLLASLGMILVATIGLSLSSSVIQLVIFRGLNGLGWGIGSTLCMTLATSCFPSDRVNTSIGIYALGRTIAEAVAPVTALALIAAIGFNKSYYVNIFLIALAMILTVFLKVDGDRKSDFSFSLKVKDIIALPALVPMSVTMLDSIAGSSIVAFLVLYADTLSIINVGFYFTITSLISFCMRPVLANLIDKFSVKKVVIPCFVLEIISFILLFIAKNELCLVLSALFRGIGVAGTQTALMGMAIKSVPSEKRGLASNTSYIGLDLGGFIGSNLAGMIVAMFGYRNLYAVMILFLALAILILVSYFKKTTDFETVVV